MLYKLFTNEIGFVKDLRSCIESVFQLYNFKIQLIIDIYSFFGYIMCMIKCTQIDYNNFKLTIIILIIAQVISKVFYKDALSFFVFILKSFGQ